MINLVSDWLCRILVFQPARALLLVLLFGAVSGLWVTPNAAYAQSFGWAAAPAILFDAEFVDGTEVGPALSGELILSPQEARSYFLGLTIARTDFPVGVDELHRNWGTAALGLRFALPAEKISLRFSLGVGFLVFDDVSETDPGFRSSANWEELLLPGIEGSIPLRGRWHFRVVAQDMVTGWWNALIDPDEGAVGHRFLISVGLESR